MKQLSKCHLASYLHQVITRLLSKQTESMEFSTDTVIRGHHINKEIWAPVIGECVQHEIEPGNDHNLYAVAMRKYDRIVGHVPRTISTLCHLFLSSGGTINCTVNGVRRYSTDLPQGGLDVPCKLTFRGNQAMIETIRRLLPKRPKDPPSIVIKSSIVKPLKKGQCRSHMKPLKKEQ